MAIVSGEIAEIRQVRWADPTLSWGLVPTMGALHEGHLALVRRARQENDRTAVSIYVNPTQFAPTEDLAAYPRPLEADLALLKNEGVDLVFTPSDPIMYPPGFRTRVLVDEITTRLEGASRPTHFAGVTLVVAKLFNIVQPARAYFGQKDAQQTVVIRRMAADLNFNLEVVVCPTVRAADGLALSSRNGYLSPAEREAAPVLHRALQLAAAAAQQGEADGERLRALMRETVAAEPLARLDYASAAALDSLEEVDRVDVPTLLSLAVFFGRTRLIDNAIVHPPAVDQDTTPHD